MLDRFSHFLILPHRAKNFSPQCKEEMRTLKNTGNILSLSLSNFTYFSFTWIPFFGRSNFIWRSKLTKHFLPLLLSTFYFLASITASIFACILSCAFLLLTAYRWSLFSSCCRSSVVRLGFNYISICIGIIRHCFRLLLLTVLLFRFFTGVFFNRASLAYFFFAIKQIQHYYSLFIW